MKKYFSILFVFALGFIDLSAAENEIKEDIHPISNPIYNDTATPKTQITSIYAFHKFPNKISTTAGKLPLDGYLQVLAVQAEYALNEQFSLVANKDGILFFNPDETLNVHEGVADIAAGFKWLFYSNDIIAAAIRATFEIPLGKEEVFQGNGDGSVNPVLIATCKKDKWQINKVLGAVIPFDSGEKSLIGHASLDIAYRLTNKLAGLLEFHWAHIFSAGNGSSDFSGQLDKTIPAIARFDGPDFFNFGAANSDQHRDLVTAAVGLRYALNENVSLGAAWEFPLTEEENNLFDHRAYLNLAVKL